jgi:hypothetical protein
MDELELLGQADPPAPGVLDAAREILWSAVAAEMLATGPAPGRTAAADPDPSAQLRREEPGT